MVDIIPQTFLRVWIITPMLTQSPILFSAMSERLKCIAEEWIAHSPRNAIAAVAARPVRDISTDFNSEKYNVERDQDQPKPRMSMERPVHNSCLA